MRPLDLTLRLISPTNWDKDWMKYEMKRKYDIMNVKVEVN